MNKLYIRNSDGRSSASLTMAWVSFLIVTGWLLFWIVGTSFKLSVPEFDSTAAMGYMTPLLALYFGRRWSEEKVASAKAANSTQTTKLQEVEQEVVESEPAE